MKTTPVQHIAYPHIAYPHIGRLLPLLTFALPLELARSKVGKDPHHAQIAFIDSMVGDGRRIVTIHQGDIDTGARFRRHRQSCKN